MRDFVPMSFERKVQWKIGDFSAIQRPMLFQDIRLDMIVNGAPAQVQQEPNFKTLIL